MKELERFLLNLISPMTKKYYTIYINAFLEFKNIKNIDELKTLTIDDIEDWSLYLKECKNSQNSRRVKLSALSSFYDYLIERDTINKNIVKPLIKKLKIDSKEQSYLTVPEAVAMLKVIKNPKEYAVIMTMLNTGIRVSELVNIKLNDYKDDVIEIINGKGGKNRIVYLNNKTKEAIDNYLKVRKNSEYDNLFISDQGTPLHPNHINKTIKKIILKANINKKISCHSLRRTLATGLYKDGVDILAISNILGHENISTTQIYIKNQGSKMQEVMKSHSF